MKEYNGHKNYNYWNVSLWIGNDEGLYNLAREHKRSQGNARNAAACFIHDMASMGQTQTPDGVPYRISYVTAAIAGL